MLPFNALGAFLMFRRHEAFRQRNVLVPIERCKAVKRDAVILINLMLKNLLGFVEGEPPQDAVILIVQRH